MQFAQIKTAKMVAYSLLGLYGAHFIANMIPVGAKTGWPQAGKLALATAAEGYLGGRFLGGDAGEAIFTGGALLTGLEVVGIVSGGKYGNVPGDAAPPAKDQKLLGPPQAAATIGVNNSTGDSVASTYSYSGVN